MKEITIPARKFHRIMDYLGRIDLDVQAIARNVGLSPERLAMLPPEEPLPGLHYSRLWREAVVQMQALKQPLPWAAGVGSEAFDLMCHCMISGRTLGDALDLATRFEDLIYPMIQHKVRLVCEGDVAKLTYKIRVKEQESPLVPAEWDRAGNQDVVMRASGLLIWHALCGWLVGEALESIEVNIGAPFLSDRYHEGLASVFRCPIHFDCQQSYFSFPAQQLERRLVHTPDSLKAFLDNAVYQLILIDRQPASTSAAIKSLITIDLPVGLPSFSQVSDHLHMSESSLRRRLQKENTSYQNLKDEVRCQVAIDKLLNEELKVADLAEYLGFTEPSSFVRSFKSWTGETPKSYREKMHSLSA